MAQRRRAPAGLSLGKLGPSPNLCSTDAKTAYVVKEVTQLQHCFRSALGEFIGYSGPLKAKSETHHN